MRKKFLVCLMLMACVLMQAMPVMAAGELTVAQLETLPKPEDEVTLISFADLTLRDGKYVYPSSDDIRLTNTYGSAKIVVYNASTGDFLYTVDDGFMGEEEFVNVYKTKSTKSLATALAESAVLDKVDRFDSLTKNAYVMFFSDTAMSLMDVRYCVSSQSLLNFYEPDPNGILLNPGANKFLVTVIEKQPADGVAVSAKFRLDYELNEGDEFYGNRREEKLSKIFVETLNCIYVPEADRKVAGSIEFTLDRTLKNGTYNIDVYTDKGNIYKTSFEVDFAGEDMVGADAFGEYTGSYDAPVVTFEGLPDVSVTGLTEPVEIKVKTDIPAELTFDDTAYSGYVTDTDITLLRNGSYRYIAVSEVGQVTEGVLDIQFFDPNVNITMDGLDLDESVGLYQTGIAVGQSNIVPILLIVGVFVALVGVYVIKKRGIGHEA